MLMSRMPAAALATTHRDDSYTSSALTVVCNEVGRGGESNLSEQRAALTCRSARPNEKYPIGERRSVDQLQDERVSLTAVLEPINRPNVRVVERGQHLRFALEACEAIGIERERIGDDLQRDVASQFRIARPIHFAHAAGPKGGEDLVRAEADAGV